MTVLAAAHERAVATPASVFEPIAIAVGAFLAAMVAGAIAAGLLRGLKLRWTWPAALLPAGALVLVNWQWGARLIVFAVVALAVGGRLHRNDVTAGGDIAERARQRAGIMNAVAAAVRRLRRSSTPAINHDGILLGFTAQNRPVRVAAGIRPTHVLICGATGSGKTVTQTLLLTEAIESGCGAVVMDPKGDAALRLALHDAADRVDRQFIGWDPAGPWSYNPYAHGTSSEIADKALAAEHFTEPHYQRLAQRYLGHATRAIRQSGQTPSLGDLVDVLSPHRLEQIGRQLDDATSIDLLRYLDSLTPEQMRGLAGTRDRLAILAESELGPWLTGEGQQLDLLHAVRDGSVVYFSLEADRWPLLAEMLGAQIVQDLITICGEQQRTPRRTVVAIDEFSAIAPAEVVRLFGRGRSAGLSVIAATQELADLRLPDTPGLLEQVLGNVSTVIAHRQSVPDSAELLAQVAGTRGAWVSTQRTGALAMPSSAGTRTRGREFHVHPDHIKTLPTGRALIARPGVGIPQIVQVLNPEKHHAH